MSSIDLPFVGISMADFIFEPEDIQFGTFYWFVYAGISCLLVLFAGIMSGLTLGLMSLGLVELEILQRSGSSTEKKQAGSSPPGPYPFFSAGGGGLLAGGFSLLSMVENGVSGLITSITFADRCVCLDRLTLILHGVASLFLH